MPDVTRILSKIESGDLQAADELLPLVYDELRNIAKAKMAAENPGQTLQATALVHDAYVRLVDVKHTQSWESRGHFFSAAATAMRRILVENARRKKQLQRGGDRQRISIDEAVVLEGPPSEDLLALDECLERLSKQDPIAAQLVNLRYFGGLTMAEAAESLGIPLRTAERNWTYARTWLRREMS